MSTDAFDQLTDWIGIPLTVIAIAAAMAAPLAGLFGRERPRWTPMLARVSVVTLAGIVIARFVYLA